MEQKETLLVDLTQAMPLAGMPAVFGFQLS